MNKEISETKILHAIKQLNDAFDKRNGIVDARFDAIDERLDSHEVQLSDFYSRLNKLKEAVDYVKDQVGKIPRMLTILEGFASRTQIDDQERTFMNFRIEDHENRLEVVENKLSVTPPKSTVD